jgi:arylformamidase
MRKRVYQEEQGRVVKHSFKRLGNGDSRLHDVSVPLTATTPVWPGDPPVRIAAVSRIEDGDDCNVCAVSLSCHAGTHVDVPWHFDQHGKRLDDIPLDAWLGPCYVADLPTIPISITAGDLDQALIPPDVTRLLLRTHEARPDREGFSEQFAGLAPDAAEWILARGIRLVGIDTPSIEPFHSPGDPVHKRLLDHDVLIIESLDLSAVSAGWYQLICLPLKLTGVDAAPARVLLTEDR